MSWKFWKKQQPPAPPEPPHGECYFSTHRRPGNGKEPAKLAPEVLGKLIAAMPKPESVGAMDSASTTASTLKVNAGNVESISDSLANWYASQGFIGWQMCALLAQHWLIDKACSMPARDATRKGYEIVTVDGDKLSDENAKLLKKYDKAYRAKWNAEQFVRMGRIFGIRIAMFKVDSDDPDFYKNPFNPDGVKPGSYKGIAQIDPYWCAPLLKNSTTSDPTSIHFYEPDAWIIGGKEVHRSHLCIFRTAEPPDILKPSYLYGGISVPQRIMERVYGAERTANEGPLLATSKRTNIWLTDMADFKAAGDDAITALLEWTQYRDNFNLKIGDKERDMFQQFETSLADLDNVIMTQYQLVAAAAHVPATKLLGTSPKGFNATGEYEESNYHEDLESVQEHDLTPLMERHHLLTMLSFGKDQVETTVNWFPLDAPTSKEKADENLVKAQTGAALIEAGVISPEDERRRIATDPESGYSQLGNMEPGDDDEDVLEDLGLTPEAAQAAKDLDLG